MKARFSKLLKHHKKGSSTPELPKMSIAETEPKLRDSSFHPDPSLCASCQSLRVDWVVSTDLPTDLKNPNPLNLQMHKLGRIEETRQNCQCCEAIFNVVRHGIRWATAGGYPFTPLDLVTVDKVIQSSRILYGSFADDWKKRVLLCEYDSGIGTRCGILEVFSKEPGTSTSVKERSLPQCEPSFTGPQSVHSDEDTLNIDMTAAKLQKWLETCQQSHEQCRMLKRQSMLPDRVVDIGTLEEPYIRLVETHQESISYVALSYCWGSEQTYVTTAVTMPRFLEGIDARMLPSTMKDAINLTRAIGLRYIWIDALCIVQNSREDWEKQSSKMDQVYSNAYVTICASRASGASQGFLSELTPAVARWGSWERDGSQEESIFLRWWREGRDMENILADQPLSRRGWAVQERLLSLRKVLFTSQQMIWQCPSLHCFEDGVEVSPEGGRGFPTSVLQNEDLGHDAWSSVVLDYTQCTLTKFSDRLPALSGIARTFAGSLKDEYIAGHWRETLPHSLTWRTLPKGQDCRPDGMVYSAPSWSWASVDAGVQILYRSFWDDIHVKLVDLHLSPSSSANPYGQVTDGWIELEAPVLPIRVERKFLKGYLALFKINESEFQLYSDEWSANSNVMWLDRSEDVLDALAIFFTRDDFTRPSYEGLLISPSKEREGMFVRRGGFTDCAIFPNISKPGVSFGRQHCKMLSEVDQVRVQRVKIV
ncbi:uncharacterized protein PAC_13959 [Phialocephala subalpina]|uniref:Heterokaryon incompatibility domain-containing protein n=1 Tax=Phialocephala subalpina TaxID=576137 RepID=A0A1L7XGB4_9HELO|nr:uncharacterized protein PAC_13959 [Phialocephala subalpina]